MPSITGAAIYWAVGDPVVACGYHEEMGTTVTGLTLISDINENAFLGKVAGKGATYQSLPASGWLTQGDFYSYGSNIVIVRQSHSRTLFAPSETPALFMFYQAGGGVLGWIVGERVYVGTRRTYNTVEYVCIQGHVTQADWTPPATATLWQAAAPPVAPWVAGVYAIDVLVTHSGRTWKSLMAANSYEPGVIGSWRDQTVPPMWVAPVGAVGLWQVNDLATYGGFTWRCTSANNTYQPGVYGWVQV